MTMRHLAALLALATLTMRPPALQAPVGVWQNITPPDVPQGGVGGVSCDYGTLAFAIDPTNTATIYLGTCEHGVKKTTDGGLTWTHVNTGRNGAILDGSRQWTMVIDPTNPRVLYTNSGYGGGLNNGAWKSVNGGVDWDRVWPPAKQPELVGVVQYDFVAQAYLDPTDASHLFLSFHGSCKTPYTPVCYGESHDAGGHWTIRSGDPRWVPSEAQTIYIVDGQRWLFANHADGLWRTSDAGKTWTLIDSHAAGHWPSTLYRSPTNGAFYIGADNGLYRSPDFVTWTRLPVGSLVNGVVGDGTTLFICLYGALTPWVPAGTNPYLVSPETDGVTFTPAPWPVPPGMFTQGSGGGYGYDRVHHILYSSNGTAGFWRVQTSAGPAPQP
jgi:hypothetical protein